MDNVNLAKEYVLQTDKHVFLTGKAGTGKTTFLREIQRNTFKKTVTTAPTGVAAINAGGMTLHSFFQLPFGMYVPEEMRSFDDSVQITTPTSLFYNLKLSKVKKDLMQELELLIIDEVSMLRCDTLDCIDTLLRHIRKKLDQPFGGVQVLFIGDLFQLPPVVSDENWSMLSQYYDTPFFFSARVLQEAELVNIELDKVYRQSDEEFISLLNHVRNNEMTDDDYQLLNERYQPEAIYGLENYITLCTHNWKADRINLSQLQQLQADEMEFEASIWGDFPDRNYPTEHKLILKQGAQVMFIKNDTSLDKKYYNGKLATIKRIYHDEIVVNFFDSREEFSVKKETWKNIRYQFNASKNKVEEEEIGAFTQYPLKLAWAVTIHKSQGLTFEKAVIDAGQSFAAGQVYVALSRCTNMEGMFLLTPIHAEAIMTEKKIIDYTKISGSQKTILTQKIGDAKTAYAKLLLLKAFDWTKMMVYAEAFKNLVEEKQIPFKDKAINLVTQVLYKVNEQRSVADKFLIQLQQLLQTNDTDLLQERMQKAIDYFGKSITTDIVTPLHQHLEEVKTKAKAKKYTEGVLLIEKLFCNKLVEIEKLQFNGMLFYEGPAFFNHAAIDELEIKAKNKPQKGDSHRESLTLYKEGKSIEEIAEIRGLSKGTIEGHLTIFIGTGEVDIYDFLTKEALLEISDLIENNNKKSVGELREILREKYTFSQLRMAQSHYQTIKANKN